MGLAWDRVPADFALGIFQTCDPSPARWRTSPPTWPTPTRSGHSVGVALRSGIGAGIEGADEVRLEGRIDGVPRLIDVLQLDETIDVVHTPDHAPDLVVERLELAIDDTSRSDDQPVHVHGRLDGVPAHVLVEMPETDGRGTPRWR